MRRFAYITIIAPSVLFVTALIGFTDFVEQAYQYVVAEWKGLLTDTILGVLFALFAWGLNKKVNQAIKEIKNIIKAREKYVQDKEKPSLMRLLKQAILSCEEMVDRISDKKPNDVDATIIKPANVLKLLSHMSIIRNSIINMRLDDAKKVSPLIQIDNIINTLAFKEIGISELEEFQRSLTAILSIIKNRSK